MVSAEAKQPVRNWPDKSELALELVKESTSKTARRGTYGDQDEARWALAEFCQRYGTSARALARQAGVKDSAISAFLQGYSDLRRDLLEGIILHLEAIRQEAETAAGQWKREGLIRAGEGRGFGEELRRERRAARLGLKRLSKSTGMSSTVIRHIELGTASARPEQAGVLIDGMLAAVQERREWARTVWREVVAKYAADATDPARA